MARRTITIPNFTQPGGVTTSTVVIEFALVDEDGVLLDGYTDTEGIVGTKQVTVGSSEQTITLSPQADIAEAPKSQWRIRIYEGTKRIRETYVYLLEEDGSALDFDDFLAKGRAYFTLPFTYTLPQVRSGDYTTQIDVTLTDASGNAIDLTGATVALTVDDSTGTEVLSWTLAGGEIVDPNADLTQGQIRISAQEMTLAAGTYTHFLTFTLASGTITTYWTGSWVVTA